MLCNHCTVSLNILWSIIVAMHEYCNSVKLARVVETKIVFSREKLGGLIQPELKTHETACCALGKLQAESFLSCGSYLGHRCWPPVSPCFHLSSPSYLDWDGLNDDLIYWKFKHSLILSKHFNSRVSKPGLENQEASPRLWWTEEHLPQWCMSD